MDLSKVSDQITKVLVTEEQINEKVAELAAELDKKYADKDVLLVGVLKGAVMFMADLSRAMQIPVQMDWMAVSSYGHGTQSSGVVRILKDLDADVLGLHMNPPAHAALFCVDERPPSRHSTARTA